MRVVGDEASVPAKKRIIAIDQLWTLSNGSRRNIEGL